MSSPFCLKFAGIIPLRERGALRVATGWAIDGVEYVEVQRHHHNGTSATLYVPEDAIVSLNLLAAPNGQRLIDLYQDFEQAIAALQWEESNPTLRWQCPRCGQDVEYRYPSPSEARDGVAYPRLGIGWLREPCPSCRFIFSLDEATERPESLVGRRFFLNQRWGAVSKSGVYEVTRLHAPHDPKRIHFTHAIAYRVLQSGKLSQAIDGNVCLPFSWFKPENEVRHDH